MADTVVVVDLEVDRCRSPGPGRLVGTGVNADDLGFGTGFPFPSYGQITLNFSVMFKTSILFLLFYIFLSSFLLLFWTTSTLFIRCGRNMVPGHVSDSRSF